VVNSGAGVSPAFTTPRNRPPRSARTAPAEDWAVLRMPRTAAGTPIAHIWFRDHARGGSDHARV